MPQAASVNILVPTAAERGGDFSRSVDGSGRAITITDPHTAAPFPGNIVPANRIYAPGKSILNFLPAPNTTAGGRVQLHFAGPQFLPSQREHPARRLSNQFERQAQRTLGVQSRRSAIRLRHDDRFVELAADHHGRKNGPGSIPTLSLTNNFGPTWINEFIFGAGRGGVTIAPKDDRATRASSGINTPLLYPEANESGLIPSLVFGGIASVSAPVTTSVFGTFDQRFAIWHAMDNVTKVTGKHAFKFGFYYQSASNASNSQTHVESDIDFTANGSNPLNTGNPFSNALLGVYNSYTQASTKPTRTTSIRISPGMRRTPGKSIRG